MGKPTKGQTKVLVALLLLERLSEGRRWWLPHTIGQVAAGDFDRGRPVQYGTLNALYHLGYLTSQAKTLPLEVRRAMVCDCASGHYGLTQAGREYAERFKVAGDDESFKEIREAIRFAEMVRRSLACHPDERGEFGWHGGECDEAVERNENDL